MEETHKNVFNEFTEVNKKVADLERKKFNKKDEFKKILRDFKEEKESAELSQKQVGENFRKLKEVEKYDIYKLVISLKQGLLMKKNLERID